MFGLTSIVSVAVLLLKDLSCSTRASVSDVFSLCVAHQPPGRKGSLESDSSLVSGILFIFGGSWEGARVFALIHGVLWRWCNYTVNLCSFLIANKSLMHKHRWWVLE